MNFTLVNQMKGFVIRVIADNNPGLHRRASGFHPSLPITASVLSAAANNRDELWTIPPLIGMIKPATDSKRATQGGMLKSHTVCALNVNSSALWKIPIFVSLVKFDIILAQVGVFFIEPLMSRYKIFQSIPATSGESTSMYTCKPRYYSGR